MIGESLAHYKVVEKIGAGGMGEVYRATDSRLGRDVALKLLPPAFASDEERMARFQREAQVLASLNHPNIAAIYGVEETGESRFLVLELVPGPTLEDRILAGPLPPDEALDIATQIAVAVESAHDSGVVHRDLKPANVKVTEDGMVKVLDFGLAKALEKPGAASGDASGSFAPTLSPTLASPITGALTGANVILGTAAYMSPEQARGRPVDRRSDIWSFGVILFEMLTGRRMFGGETVSDIIASILKTEPDWSRLPPAVPPRLRELLERCLTKDPRQRLRDMGDVRLELEWIRDGKGVAAEAPAAPRRRVAGLRGLLGTAGLASVLGAVLGILLWDARSERAPDAGAPTVSRLNLDLPEGLDVFDFSLSPDGRTLAAIGRPARTADGEEVPLGLYLRRLDDYEVRLVPGSQGLTAFCFSLDGKWLAIVAPEDPRSTRLYVWKVPVGGGAPPFKLLDWNSDWLGLHWLPDGDLMAGSRSRELVRIPTDGRPAPAPIPVVADFDVEITIDPVPRHGTRLPGDHHLLSWIETWGERGYGQNIVVVDIRSGEAKVLVEDGGHPQWSDTGHLLFSRGTTLLAVPFDPEALTVTGGPVALLDDLRISTTWSHGRFDVSPDGTLVYQPGGYIGGNRRLAWLDRDFRETGPWSEERLAIEHGPFVSRDGRVAAVMSGPDGVYDVWMSEPGRPVLHKWLEEPNRDCFAEAWSPDGTRMVYQTRTARETLHYIRPVDGDTRTLLVADRSPESRYAASGMADDGATLLMTHWQGGARRIVRLSLTEADDGEPPVETVLEEASNPRMSPDGRWMAYRSDASGRQEVYLRRWLGGGRLGPERRVSTEGSGNDFLWYTAGDGSPPEIWYFRNMQVYAVTVRTDPELSLSPPRAIAEWRPDYHAMDTLPDGRLLMCFLGEEEGPFGRVNVVRGWTRDLESRLGRAARPAE